MVVVLAGGGGGAKLVQGLAQILSPEELVIIGNTGDDLKLHGLYISPDLDSILYHLAGIFDEHRGWGISGDAFQCHKRLNELGAETWFQLGDRDLATHLWRTEKLLLGESLAQVTHQLASAMRIKCRILPMTNQYAPTQVATSEGVLHFQEYFAQHRCEPAVYRFHYADAEQIQPAPGVLEALNTAKVIVLAPSNPFLSIAPILAVSGLREALLRSSATIIAVSPIVEGQALKGPTAKLLRELGYEVSALGVARFYNELVDVFVLDRRDAELEPQIAALGMRVHLTDTMMRTLEERCRLACLIKDWGLSNTQDSRSKTQGSCS